MTNSKVKVKAPTKQQLQEQLRQMQAKLAYSQIPHLAEPQTQPSIQPLLQNALISQQEQASQLSQITPPETAKTSFTPSMVETLLQLRYELFQAVFQRCSSNAQRTVIWEKLTLRFCVITGQKVDSSIVLI